MSSNLAEIKNVERTGLPSIDKPWLKYYSEEAINAPLPECTIYEYLVEKNIDYPKDVAINYYGRKITYKELFNYIDATAKSLIELNVKYGDIVTVALPSIPEALYVVYALNKIGAIANMIHPLAGKKEIIHYLNEVHSELAVLFDETYGIIKDSINETSIKNAVIVSAADSLPFGLKLLYRMKKKSVRNLSGLSCLMWRQFIRIGERTTIPEVHKNINETAIISHTGGTTGEPKGVMCSDKNANALMHQIVCNFKYSRQGVSLAVLPPFINYSLIEAMMAMFAIGYQVVLIPDYQPLKFAEYVKKYRPNIILSIPPYWEAILKIDKINSVDMSCLEQIYSGGEAISRENEQAVNDILQACGSKTPLMKGLGATEMIGGATQTYDNCNVLGSVGIPLVKVQCKIVNTDDYEELGYCEEGEICFAGETVMLGYYNNETATNDIVKVHVDGQRWLHTGDLGYIDENGILFVTGRIKRIIMTKGTDQQPTKLFPDRIEKVLNTHSAVELSCVIGIPDADRINYPKAIIELKDKANNVNKKNIREELMSICRKNLPGYMVPDEIEFIDNMPRTPRGKVDYRTLEELSIGKNQ